MDKSKYTTEGLPIVSEGTVRSLVRDIERPFQKRYLDDESQDCWTDFKINIFATNHLAAGLIMLRAKNYASNPEQLRAYEQGVVEMYELLRRESSALQIEEKTSRKS